MKFLGIRLKPLTRSEKQHLAAVKSHNEMMGKRVAARQAKRRAEIQGMEDRIKHLEGRLKAPRTGKVG